MADTSVGQEDITLQTLDSHGRASAPPTSPGPLPREDRADRADEGADGVVEAGHDEGLVGLGKEAGGEAGDQLLEAGPVAENGHEASAPAPEAGAAAEAPFEAEAEAGIEAEAEAEVEAEAKSAAGEEAAAPALEKKDDAKAVGGVRRVLKSGVFGGAPKPTPRPSSKPAANAGLAASARLSRPSLAPARPAATTGTGTTAHVRLGPTSRLSASTTRPAAARPTGSAAGTTSTTAGTAGAASRPRAATAASDKTASSGTARAAVSASASTTAAARPRLGTVGSTAAPAAASARVAAGTTARQAVGAARPGATTASTAGASSLAAKRAEGLRASTTGTTVAGATTAAPRPTARAAADVGVKRAPLAASRTATSGTTGATVGLTRPLAGRASMAPSTTARTAGAGVAQKIRAGSGPSALASGGKEVAELKAKVEELEKKISEEKDNYEGKIAELSKEKADLEKAHAQALEELRAELTAATEKAGADADSKIAELKALHETELKAAEEQRAAILQEMIAKLQKFGAEHSALKQKVAVSQSQLASSASEISTLRSSLSAAESQLAELQTSSSARDSTISTLESTKAALETQLAELEGVKAALEAQIKEGEEEAERSIADASGMGAKVSELEEKIQVLEKELEGQKKGRNDKEEEWGEAKEALEKELAEAKVACEGHSEALAAAGTNAAASKEELNALRIAHDQLTTTYADLVQSSSRHPEALSDLQTQLQEATDKHAALLLEAGSASSAKIQELENALAEVRLGKEAKEKEAEAVQGKLEKLEEELAQLAEVTKGAEEKEKALNEIILGLEADLEKARTESEARYASGFEDGKQSSDKRHHDEVVSIRSDLAATSSQVKEAHTAELEALSASHSTAIAQLSAEHNTALQAIELSLKAANAQIEQEKLRIESVEEERGALDIEMKRLLGEVEKSKAEGGKADEELEKELKRVKNDLQHVSDELAGAKEMAEMNKSSFEQTIHVMQEQHNEDALHAAEAKTRENEQLKAQFEQELEALRTVVKRLKVELEDEKVEKNSAVARLAERMRSPPNSPAPSNGESITKLHEAHNAKIIEKDNVIRELMNEVARLKAGPALQESGNNSIKNEGDDQDETMTF